MPGDMDSFSAPVIPEPEAVRHLHGAREAMMWLRQSLATYGSEEEPLLANLSGLDPENRELVNQILGEGEVSVNYNGAFRARSQEAVLAGVWRTLYLDQEENVCYDLLEVADITHMVTMPDSRTRPVNADTVGVAPELNNALAILVELEAASLAYADSATPHSVNLTLLPLSESEREFIDARLGRGPVDTLSRSYGKCQVSSTLSANVWWVRYYNSMDTLILNTIEVIDVPEAIRAAPEDLGDSAARLDSILTPYWSVVA
jgi:hydrogenase-1 operon protein HyaF